MLIKVINGTPEPYTIGALKKDNPSVSFPKQITDDVLAEYDVYNVRITQQPDYDKATQNCTLSRTPTLVDGQWILQWSVIEKTAEEVQQYSESCALGVRIRRDQLLAESDWTQLADAPVDASAWAAYRQELRDITLNANFPNLQDTDWPETP
jgi:hypothetical protein